MLLLVPCVGSGRDISGVGKSQAARYRLAGCGVTCGGCLVGSMVAKTG